MAEAVGEPTPSIVPVTRGAESCHPLARIHEMDPASVVGEAVEHEHVFHVGASTTGEMVAGVWSCSPCTERIDEQPCDEFCQILEGTVVLTAADGTAHEFGPGDGFVIPKGWTGTWHMPVPVRKTYVILDPETDSTAGAA
jgi:hypothetical protein